MNTNLKALLAVATVMALAAAPAMAKSHVRVPQAAPAAASFAGDAHASVVAPNWPAQTVYAPNRPVSPYPTRGLTPDFQLSHL